jgi:hypothetical protein
MGAVIYSVVVALGEMTTLFPVSGSFVGCLSVTSRYPNLLKSDCRPIMPLDGLTRLSVSLLVITTGTRMLSWSPPKLRLRQSSFPTGTPKLIQEHGSQSCWLPLFFSICMRYSTPVGHLFHSPDFFYSCAVQYYGEAEFWFTCIKVTTVRKSTSTRPFSTSFKLTIASYFRRSLV